jgi:hypothetical protein
VPVLNTPSESDQDDEKDPEEEPQLSPIESMVADGEHFVGDLGKGEGD